MDVIPLHLIEKIPIRVIINEIFPFIEIYELDIRTRKDLYGYFKVDKYRKIFFLFPSLYFYMETLGFMYDLTKIQSLHFAVLCDPSYEENRSMRRLVSTHSTRMKRLESLRITFTHDCYNEPNCRLKNAINMDFPNLRSLHIDIFDNSMENYFDVTNFLDKSSSIWKTLKKLSFFIREESIKEKTFPFFNGEKLTKLAIKYDEFAHGYEINTPLLESVELTGCKNLIIRTGKYLKEVNYDGDNPNIIFQPIMNSRRIKNVIIQLDYIHSIDWLFNYDGFSELQELTLHKVDFPSTFTFKLSRKLTKIYLSCCKGFDERLLFTDLKNLKKLYLISMDFRGNKRLSWCRNLERLELRELENFDGMFFQKNQFPELRKLKIDELKFREGKYPIFPNLEKIDYGFCYYENKITELTVLNQENFPKLQRMEGWKDNAICVKDIKEIKSREDGSYELLIEYESLLMKKLLLMEQKKIYVQHLEKKKSLKVKKWIDGVNNFEKVLEKLTNESNLRLKEHRNKRLFDNVIFKERRFNKLNNRKLRKRKVRK